LRKKAAQAESGMARFFFAGLKPCASTVEGGAAWDFLGCVAVRRDVRREGLRNEEKFLASEDTSYITSSETCSGKG